MAPSPAHGSLAGSQTLSDHYRRLGGELFEASSEGLEHNRLRVGRQGDLMVCEEVYPHTQAHGVRFTRPLPWLFVVQAGELALDLDHASKELFLEAQGEGPNVCLTTSITMDITVMQPGTTLSRLQLPATCRWKPRASSRCVRADLSLLLPMVRTAFAAADHPPALAVGKAITDNLFNYISEQLGAAGVQLSQELDPITQLIEYIQIAAEEDLSLVDLARSASISARRLQELTREKFNLTPMELLRRERLKLLHRYIRDPRQQGVPLGRLLRRLHLSDTAKTREAFKLEYGALPSEVRRLNQYGDRVA
ncbi:MAG: helix-turn-helix domain-containing protein [Prochlorococcaceae cyanobacterium]